MDFDFESQWRPIWQIKTHNFFCDTAWKLENLEASFGKFHDVISSDPMPVIAALCSRLAELGVRTTFLVVTSIISLLMDELDERSETILKSSDEELLNEEKKEKEIDEWKAHYDLVLCSIEHANRCFGIVLILNTAVDFTVALLEIQNILLHKGKSLRYNVQFIHILLRFLIVLIASNQIKSKVVFFIGTRSSYI